MPEWTVAWKAEVTGTSTVEAETEEEALELVAEGEGVEISNIIEIYEYWTTDAEWFQE